MATTGRKWIGRGERGEGKIGLIIAILVVVGVIYILKQWIPTRIANAELAQFVDEHNRQYVLNQIKEDALIQGIVDEAARKGLPVQEDDIQVVEGDRMVTVTVDYDVKKTLVGGKVWTLHYHISKESPRL